MNAVARRERLLKELEKIEDFLRLYNEFAGDRETVSAPSQSAEKRDLAPRKKKTKTRAPRHSKLKPGAITAECRRILEKEGLPMTRGQLADALLKSGIKLPSDDPAKYVGTLMWRARATFENIPNAGYWLKGKSPKHPDDGTESNQSSMPSDSQNWRERPGVNKSDQQGHDA
jgi:hypothetical protein